MYVGMKDRRELITKQRLNNHQIIGIITGVTLGERKGENLLRRLSLASRNLSAAKETCFANKFSGRLHWRAHLEKIWVGSDAVSAEQYCLQPAHS